MIFNRGMFFERLRESFRTLTPGALAGTSEFLRLVEKDLVRGADIRHLAYAMATAWHETAMTMEPITERGGTSYFEGLYDSHRGNTKGRRDLSRKMGNIDPGDGVKYRGRGYVQLTWRNNYRLAGDQLGIDLEGSPELACKTEVAYLVLTRGLREGWFTGRKISDYLTATKTDYIGARACVNGTDHAVDIAAYAIHFERALGAASYAKASHDTAGYGLPA